MTTTLVPAALWLLLAAIGLVPGTPRRPVDAFAASGRALRGVYVFGLLAVTVLVSVTILAASDPHGGRLLAGGTGLGGCLLVEVLASRVRLSRWVGPHGSSVPSEVPGEDRDVNGSYPVVPSAQDVTRAAARLRRRLQVRRRVAPRGVVLLPTWYRRFVHPDGFDLARLFPKPQRLDAAPVVGLALLVGSLVVAGGLRDVGIEVPQLWWVCLFVAVVMVIGEVGSTTLRSVGRCRRSHLTWHSLAAAHGWRLTRPGLVPFAGWSEHPAWAPWSQTDGKASPLLTLSGQVGQWCLWLGVGRARDPDAGLVVALWLPGASLPQVRIERCLVPFGPRATATTDPVWAESLLTPEVRGYLEASLPSFVDLLVGGDLLALVLPPKIEPEPWMADVMVACLLGLADRLPAAPLLDELEPARTA